MTEVNLILGIVFKVSFIIVMLSASVAFVAMSWGIWRDFR